MITDETNKKWILKQADLLVNSLLYFYTLICTIVGPPFILVLKWRLDTLIKIKTEIQEKWEDMINFSELKMWMKDTIQTRIEIHKETFFGTPEPIERHLDKINNNLEVRS